MKDWTIRALKTFVEAFFGILIPEIVIILNNISAFENTHAVWAVLFPFICSALAAGITAVWNIALEWLKNAEQQSIG